MTGKHQSVPATDQNTQRCDSPRRTRRPVAVAWPTGRPIYPYTVDELAEGVDVYPRAMKARAAASTKGGRRDEDQRQPSAAHQNSGERGNRRCCACYQKWSDRAGA